MSMEASFDWSELHNYIKFLDRSDELIMVELYKTAVIAMDAYKQAVIGYTPADRGKLRQTYQYDIRTTANSIRAELYSPLIYALPMERGRAPGKFPPIKTIALWALRKGIVSRGENVIGIAFLIARAIAEGRSAHQVRGEEGGFRMFEQGYEAARPKVDKFMDKALGDIVITGLKG